MFVRIRSNKNSKNQGLALLAFMLIGSVGMGLAGCAGVVSASKSTGDSNPTTLTISSAHAAAATMTSFQADWSTSLPATSQVVYGKTTAYGSNTAVDPTMLASHQITVASLSSNTTYHFQIHSSDASGASAVSDDMTVTTLTDTVAPTVSIASPVAGATLSATTPITVTASDSVGVTSVQLKVDSANSGAPLTVAPYTFSLNTKTLSDGNHVLSATATDTAGNTGTSATVSVKVNNSVADTTPPTVSVTAPASGATVSSTVSVTANASDNVAVASVQFQLDGANVGALDTTAPYAFSWNTATAANGAHTLRAIATDSSNNSTTSAAVTVTVNNTASDTTPPTVSVTAPASGAAVSGTVNVTATASDNVAVASVQFQLDGANVGALDTTAPYAFSWNTATATNGSHTLRAIAKDTSNNSTTSAVVTVTVNNAADTTPPTVSITAPASGATVSSTVSVTATASDNVAVASVQFQLDGANVGTLDTTSPYAFSWNTTTATNGSHTLRAIAKDTSSNSTTSAGVTVTVNNVADTTPPSVPTGLTATAASSSQINLSWNASTDNIGVTGYNVFRGGTKIGTSATTSYFDSGLTASTNYTYNVSAFDAAGNTSAQSSSANATTLATTSSGIPPALGWFQIPNTLMSSVCPAGLDCENVIVPWSGGVADTSRNRLIIWGGGHTDYSGNEVYALNLGANPISLTRLNNPSPQVSGCTEVSSDGTPPSRHTYDGLAYIANVDRMMSWVGSMAPSGCATQDTWTLLLSNLQWTNQSPAGKYPGPNGGVGASDYDPNTTNVFAYTESFGQFASYNYSTNSWTALSSGQGVDNETTAVVDPKRKLFLIFGAGQVAKIDISGNDKNYTLVNLNGTNCSFASAQAPGVAYDPVQDRVVGWSGGNTAYMYNPDTDSCTSATYPNGPGAQQALGTYGRFRYFPALGVFAVVNDAAENAYTLRLTSAGGTGGGTGPNLSNVTVASITTTGATVTWTTDVTATSQVEYGTTAAYGTMTTLNSTLVTSHAVSLTGLTIDTLYHYRVHSKNSAGIESISGDATFSTNNTTDTTPPTVSITAPTAGSTVSGTVAVNATASDNVAVASVQFLLDGANLGAAVTSAPYSTSWNTVTSTNATHTLTAKATDTSGNVGNSVGVAVTVANSAGTDPATLDFQARCAAPGVVACEGWDNPSEFGAATGGGGYANGLYAGDDGNLHGTMDTTNKVSGAGSLMFTIDKPATPGVTGFWRENFGALTNLTAFGDNSTLYMQFRWRVDPPMLTFDWSTVSDEGWKVFIAYGPIPGPSCTGAQFVQENTFQRNVATAYTSCGAPGLETNNGVPPYLLEQGDYNCPYNSDAGYTSNPNCFAYLSNTWMTEYWIVQTGTYGTASTHFTAYIAADGQPLKKWLDLPNFSFNDGPAASDSMESILLGPYMSGANGSKPNPTAHMWFDELIISTQPIAAPKF